MYLSTKASRIRQREAQRARDNRAEIVKARSLGQVDAARTCQVGPLHGGRRAGVQERLEPVRPQRLCAVPTGTPRSPLYGAQKFTQPLPRLRLQTPMAPDPEHQRWL